MDTPKEIKSEGTNGAAPIGAQHRMAPASLANLKPGWAKGRSGNPSGRAKGQPSLTRLIVKVLDEPVGKAKKPKTLWEALARSIVVAAIKGSYAQQSEIWQRVDGKVPDRLIADMAVDHSFERALERAYGDGSESGATD
jgi:hypothetical protein